MPSDLTLHSPHALWLLLLVPALWLWHRRKAPEHAALRISTAHVALRTPGFRVRLLRALPALEALAVVLTVVALARPQTTAQQARDLTVEGIDIVLALDLSTSMDAQDFRPKDRLHVAKDVLTEFITARANDRIGLVVFAGVAVTQAPLTLDYDALKNVVAQLRTRVLTDGTAIGDALATSLNRLRDSDAKSRVVILITDGENNAGKISPLDATAMAKALKIPVFTILVGKGGRVPFPTDGRDLFGNPISRDMEVKVNPELLQKMSSETGGESYRATNRQELKDNLQAILDKMERSKLLEGGAAAQYSEEFHWPLSVAFALVALELLLRATYLKVLP
jgi:Ca-activated chloride channel family protein